MGITPEEVFEHRKSKFEALNRGQGGGEDELDVGILEGEEGMEEGGGNPLRGLEEKWGEDYTKVLRQEIEILGVVGTYMSD